MPFGWPILQRSQARRDIENRAAIFGSICPTHYTARPPEQADLMQVQVNGDTMQIADDATLAGLIELMQLSGKRLAIELNGQIVPRSMHAQTTLQANDLVEIVQAIGGG